jgi:hypothetical protein
VTAWLLTGVTFAVLWTLWLFGNYVADLFENHRKAARHDGEDVQATKGSGSFL